MLLFRMAAPSNEKAGSNITRSSALPEGVYGGEAAKARFWEEVMDQYMMQQQTSLRVCWELPRRRPPHLGSSRNVDMIASLVLIGSGCK